MVTDAVIEQVVEAVRTRVRPDLEAAQVDDVVQRWPFFQSARLLAAALHHAEGRSREEVARSAAIRLPDRSRLFFLDEVLEVRPTGGEDAMALDEPANDESHEATPAPASEDPVEGNDDLEIMDQAPPVAAQVDEDTPDEEVEGEADEVIDFLSWLRSKQAVRQPGSTAPEDEVNDQVDDDGPEDIHEPVSATEVRMMLEAERSSARLDDFLADQIARKRRPMESSSAQDGPVSETLAQILAAQGKWDEAIAMYERLAAKHPEKNRFFADRISEIRTKTTD